MSHTLIPALIHSHDSIQKLLDASARGGNNGNHRNTYHATKGLVVEIGPTRLKLVVHIHGDDHSGAHVDKLGGEVKVALEVRGNNRIYNNVGGVVYNMAAHIDLLG